MRLRTLVTAALLTATLAPAAPAVALTPTATATPAQAGPTGLAQPGLLLTYTGSDNTWVRGLWLHCDPVPAGRHPKAAEACAALDAAGGDLNDLPKWPAPCSLQHDPVTARASGTHRGRPVAWERTYPNLCVLQAQTGPVFDF